MIKLKHNRVGLTAVYTRVFHEIVKHPFPIPVPILFAVLVSSTVVFLSVFLVVSFRKRTLTGLADIRPNPLCFVPKTEVFQCFGDLALTAFFRVHTGTIPKLRFEINIKIPNPRGISAEPAGLEPTISPRPGGGDSSLPYGSRNSGGTSGT
jgi:hypothetical protein